MHRHHCGMHNITSPIAHHHGLDHRERLENMLADLLRLMAEQRGGSRNRVDVAAETLAGPGDSHAQSMTQRDLDFCIGERETARLIELEAALKRLNEGTYGICTVCGGRGGCNRMRAAYWAAVATSVPRPVMTWLCGDAQAPMRESKGRLA